VFYSEFREIRTGDYFGLKEHPSREAAEAYVIGELMRLGTSESAARAAAGAATWTCAENRDSSGRGVRIFEKG
jgi:hypothetical protein